jgi:Tfp pilus assembly protein PilE
MLILETIWTALKAIFATPERIFIAAVLIILAVSGGAMLTYRHERDTARAALGQAQADLAKAAADNKALAGTLVTQNAAVADLQAQAKLRQYQAAKADADAQAVQSRYTVLAGKVQAQAPGADQCASLHALRVTFVKERP